MDLIEQIEELQALIEEAKAVPLSSSAVVNREEILDLLAQLKESVPDEIRQARWMARDHEELLDKARAKAQGLIEEAKEERDRLLGRTKLVAAAERKAEAITEEAEERAARIKAEAEEFIDQKLAAFESLLDKTLTIVSRGRQQLGAQPPERTQVTPERRVVFDADATVEQVST